MLHVNKFSFVNKWVHLSLQDFIINNGKRSSEMIFLVKSSLSSSLYSDMITISLTSFFGIQKSMVYRISISLCILDHQDCFSGEWINVNHVFLFKSFIFHQQRIMKKWTLPVRQTHPEAFRIRRADRRCRHVLRAVRDRLSDGQEENG